MFRIAAAALCLTASAASADQLVGFVHTHVDGYTGSFSTPFNYRPNRAEGLVVVRSNGFNEANTKVIKSRRPGVTTGTSIAPPNGVTGYGQSSTTQVLLGGNLPYK